MQTVVLQDGTVLTPSDGSIHFLESKRCVTIFTAPGAQMHDGGFVWNLLCDSKWKSIP
jgi:hypothetical protein